MWRLVPCKKMNFPCRWALLNRLAEADKIRDLMLCADEGVFNSNLLSLRQACPDDRVVRVPDVPISNGVMLFVCGLSLNNLRRLGWAKAAYETYG